MHAGYRQFVRCVSPRLDVCACASLALSCGLIPACAPNPTDETGRLTNARVLGETGTHLGQFVYPRAMDVFESNGQPLAAIMDKTARLQILNLQTGTIVGAIKTPEWDQGMPTGVTVAPSLVDPTQNAIYVADTHEHRVLVYAFPLPIDDEPGPLEPIFSFGSFGHENGQFVYPTDVAVRTDKTGRVIELYISEYGGNDRVSVFSVAAKTDNQPAVAFSHAIGIASETMDGSDDPRALSRPQSIALRENHTGNTELVLTDSSHHRIGRFTLKGEPIMWIENTPETEHPFRFPYGLVILDDSSALITEFGSCLVRHLDLETGETLRVFGAPGRGDGQLATPWASGVIEGKVVVLDSGNSRLQIFRAPGINAEQLARTGGAP